MDLTGARRLPFMARQPYVNEIRHFIFWGMFAGLVEGTVSAVVVAKTFQAGWLLITVVQATPAFANLVSLWWGALIVGRPKIPALTAFGAACVAVTLAVAFTPQTPLGGWIFALQVCLARVFMSGVVTTRASLWKSNYPRSHRGRITANLQFVRTAMSLPVILGGGLLFDWSPSAYHWFYPAVGVIGLIGLFFSRGIRVRGERIPARDDSDPIEDAGVAAPFSLVAFISPWHLYGQMRQVFRDDPRFARYCRAQMYIGTANLMVIPVNTIVLTQVLHLSYTAANTLLDIVPRALMFIMLPIWARLFDRVGVLRFRMSNSLCWCGSITFCGLGALFAGWHGSPHQSLWLASLVVYSIGRILDGLAQSGGAIAWNIGHLHFAEDERADLYMGIHVSLTGVRGLIAPFLGTFLYVYFGWVVFLFALAVSALGYASFARLAKEEMQRAAKADAPESDETSPATTR